MKNTTTIHRIKDEKVFDFRKTRCYLWKGRQGHHAMTNAAAKEHERRSTPPGPETKTAYGFGKRNYSEAERSAFATMPVPFMITLAAKQRLTTTEWLELVLATLAPLGLDLQVDAFRNQRDHSVHLALYNLKHEDEASVIASLWSLSRKLGGRVGKRKTKTGKKAVRFLVPGLSAAYAWSHDEVASGSTSPATLPT